MSKKAPDYVVDAGLVVIDKAELTVRIIEAIANEARPSGQTPNEILHDMPVSLRGVAMRATEAAVDFFLESLGDKAKRVQ